MAKRTIVQGSTNQTIDIFIPDSSSTTGAGLTGLVYNSSGLTCYFREGATGTATALTLATQTVGGAHADGGFVEIDATNMPGMYRLDLSDTMVSGTAPWVTIHLKGATNMAPVSIELELTKFDPFDAVRGGLTALPNANADAAGGLPISDAGGLDLDALVSELAKVPKSDGTATWNATALASINSEVLDVLNTDSFAELSSVPAAATTLSNMIRFIFLMSRNKTTQTSTTFTLRNNADSADIGSSTVSDSGTTLTRGVMT